MWLILGFSQLSLPKLPQKIIQSISRIWARQIFFRWFFPPVVSKNDA